MAKIKIDGTRTQTIRTVLIAAFAALAFVLLGSLGLRKLKAHGIHFDLPNGLSANVSQTANGFTYSQSQRGHTIFTIHASKITQFKGDKAELHDVAITLYGPPGSHRQDKILGSDFMYDKGSGIVTAKGSVEIDMASPAAASTPGTAAPPPDNIHVQTSDLRFDQKSGEAETDKPLAFTLPRANGKAIGGDYNSKTGVLILQREVELHADHNDNPSVVYAEHAQLLRDSHVAYLLKARSEYEGGRDSADQAILHFRPDGSIQHLDAENHVHMLTADGSELYSTTASADFNDRSQPLTAHAGGGVNFLSDNPDSSMHGNAVDGAMSFTVGADGKSALQHASFHNAVSFVLQQKSIGGDTRGSATREMTATKLDIAFSPGPAGKSLARTAVAQGGATVDLHDLPYGAPPKHSAIHGERLIVDLVDGHEVHELDGSGGTSIVNFDPDGSTDTSNGDTLHVTFVDTPQNQGPRHNAAKQTKARESAEIETAVQRGHVTMATKPARDAKAKDGSPEKPLFAEAATGTYLASTQTLRLTGDGRTPPRVHNDTLGLTATTIDYRRDTGEAFAQGDVRSSYLQKPAESGAKGTGPAMTSPSRSESTRAAMAAGEMSSQAPGIGGGGPVHVVAAAAKMERDTSTAVFFGGPNAPARMWQGANSVLAPVLELGRQQGTLIAHGADGASHEAGAREAAARESTHGPTVHATFAGKSGAGAPSVTRVSSDTLFYSDSTRRADFHGDVLAQQPTGTVHADDAQVFLSEAPAGQASRLDRMVASGHVALTQPGRRGTGERLVYTAADGNYVLTGTGTEPPRATDSQKGATTGAALRFQSGDNSVDVESNDAEGRTRRTVTDTRTPK